jgi:hypothetical protein
MSNYIPIFIVSAMLAVLPMQLMSSHFPDTKKMVTAQASDLLSVNSDFKISEVKFNDYLKAELPVGQPEAIKLEALSYEAITKPKEEVKPQIKGSKYLAKWFNTKTGQMHMDSCLSKDIGKRFVNAFAEFGEDAQVIACVTLNHENGITNGDYMVTAVSPCWSTNTKQAASRTCTYASDNSVGVDAGLFMINTFHQRKRIAKLGGPTCNFTVDSKSPSDPCNAQLIPWLHNIDNQILIILDIYRGQGFQPWVAYIKHVKPYL